MLIKQIPYIEKSELESIAERVRTKAFPNRVPFSETDPTLIGTMLRLDPKIQLSVFREDLEGKCKGFTARRANGYCVILDKRHCLMDPEGEVKFTVAHELSHVLLPDHRAILEICDTREAESSVQFTVNSQKRMEWQANVLAGAILLPMTEVIEKARAYLCDVATDLSFTEKFRYVGEESTSYFVTKLSRMYNVSRYCVAMRVYTLNLLNMNGHSYLRYDSCGRIVEGFL